MSTKGNVYASDDGLLISHGEGKWGLTDGTTRTRLVPIAGRHSRTDLIRVHVPTHLLHKPISGYTLCGTRHVSK